jgi:Type II secretion system (T2SS), protein M subtype b
MTLQPRDKVALKLLPVGLAIFGISYYLASDNTPVVVAPSVSTVAMAEKRLTRLREVAATVPVKQEMLKKAAADLADREKGLIKADTAPQAQAQIVQILRRLGAAEAPPIEFKATELGGISALGDSYGAANVTVQLDCRVDQLVNFLAAISAQNELLSTSEMRVTSSNPKDKTVGVRLTVTGVVSRKLVPEKKGGSF